MLFGSSAAGKTAALDALRGRVAGLAVHDFDEIGVPPKPDASWRRRSNEAWVRRALAYQAEGADLLLAGQTPFGELLAAPSAAHLEAISGCLLDVDDATRLARLGDRGPDWLERGGGELDDYLSWAAWMRRHAMDPAWEPDVIRRPTTEDEMHWSRWSGWRAGDPRWRIISIDASGLTVEQVAARLIEWIDEERVHLRSGTHPLSRFTF